MINKTAGYDNKFASNLKRHWDLYIIFAFLIIRLFLNMDFIINFKILSFFFAVVYVFFIVMLAMRYRVFSSLFIVFLTIDSMIGTYLWTLKGAFNFEFYATMIINFAIIVLVVQNINKDIPR